MVLKNEIFFNFKEEIRVGQEIIVQVNKEQLSKKGPTVTRDIMIQNCGIKGYPYNKQATYLDKEFNNSDRQYLRTITKLIKPKLFGLNIRKTQNKLNTWKIIYLLHGIQKDCLSIELI